MIDVLAPERQKQLRRAAKKLADAQQERDRQVVQAVREGASLREVADAVGLTHPGVKKIADRHRADCMALHAPDEPCRPNGYLNGGGW